MVATRQRRSSRADIPGMGRPATIPWPQSRSCGCDTAGALARPIAGRTSTFLRLFGGTVGATAALNPEETPMTRSGSVVLGALAAALLVACGHAPRPEARMASSEGAIR